MPKRMQNKFTTEYSIKDESFDARTNKNTTEISAIDTTRLQKNSSLDSYTGTVCRNQAK